jgi:hypothetical protein
VIVLAHETCELAKRDLVISLEAGPRIIGMGTVDGIYEPPGSLLDASRDKPSIETTGRLQSAQVVAITRCRTSRSAAAKRR